MEKELGKAGWHHENRSWWMLGVSPVRGLAVKAFPSPTLSSSTFALLLVPKLFADNFPLLEVHGHSELHLCGLRSSCF